MHHIKLILLFCSIPVSAMAQIGGKNSFDFLNVSPTARLSALGGVNVSLADHDVNFFVANPALTGDTLSGVASVNYQFYLADIGHAFFAYAHDFGRAGQVIFGVQHMQYGDIQGYDSNGTETGHFSSGETALTVSRQHQVRNFRLGINLKAVFSNITGYRAGALVTDIGGAFVHPHNALVVGLAIKNLGVVFNDYSSGSNSKLPFDVQVGTTFKPEHMPLRFSLTAFNLTRNDITYYNAAADDEEPGTLQKMLAHINVGTEILIHKNVTIMAGYNFLKHQALKLTAGGGGAGVALGFSATIKTFDFVFSRNAYVAGNAGYSFTLSTNTNNFLKRR